jgi:hypothetical protein
LYSTLDRAQRQLLSVALERERHALVPGDGLVERGEPDRMPLTSPLISTIF